LIEACLKIGVKVQQVYGITEFCGAVTLWIHEMGIETAHTHGKPLLCSEVQIFDPATLMPVERGHDGEIWCRGPMLFCFSQMGTAALVGGMMVFPTSVARA
jgi:long-subunit acyl-CoA synthetase (AMP-forming)